MELLTATSEDAILFLLVPLRVRGITSTYKVSESNKGAVCVKNFLKVRKQAEIEVRRQNSEETAIEFMNEPKLLMYNRIILANTKCNKRTNRKV